MQKCDSCGQEVNEVLRVVIREGYDRSKAIPMYNCPDCYNKKRQEQIEREAKA